MSGPDKRRARWVGAMFLFSNFIFLAGLLFFLQPALADPTDLANIAANSNRVVLGALLELLNGFAYLGVAVFMFPLFKWRFESLALGYVALRIIEFVTQLFADFSPLLLVSLSERAAGAGAAEAAGLQNMALLLADGRFWSFQLLGLVFGVSALLFYTMFYQTRLIPRFISVWGLVGALLVLLSTAIESFGLTALSTVGTAGGMVMLANELFLGVWLVVKGFEPEAELALPQGLPRPAW